MLRCPYKILSRCLFYCGLAWVFGWLHLTIWQKRGKYATNQIQQINEWKESKQKKKNKLYPLCLHFEFEEAKNKNQQSLVSDINECKMKNWPKENAKSDNLIWSFSYYCLAYLAIYSFLNVDILTHTFFASFFPKSSTSETHWRIRKKEISINTWQTGKKKKKIYIFVKML